MTISPHSALCPRFEAANRPEVVGLFFVDASKAGAVCFITTTTTAGVIMRRMGVDGRATHRTGRVV